MTTQRDAHLPLWTIYRHPADFPEGYVARLFRVEAGRVTPTTEAITGPTLEAVRAALPPGLVCLTRDPDDDPKIVESWF